MNRAERRAAKHKKPSLKPRLNRLSVMNQLALASPYVDDQMAEPHDVTYAAFDRLCTGEGDADDFDRVSMMYDTGRVRALEIDPSIVAVMEAAQHAMARMKERHADKGVFAFDGPGMKDAMEALGQYEVVVNASSPLQMFDAVREAYRLFAIGKTFEHIP